MFGPRALMRAAPQARMATRQMTNVIAGPPMERVSFPEKCAHGILISVSILSIPAWILVNIRHYKEH